MINLLWSGIVVVLLLSGCGWNGTPTRNNDFTPLTSIEISAVSSTIAAGTSTRLSAKGNFSGLFTRDITDQVVWSSGSKTIADFVTTVPSRVKGLASGNAVLTATVGGVSSTLTLTVSNATVASMTITPVAPNIFQGLTTQFMVSGTFSDTTTQDLTFDAVWTSDAPTVASIVSNDPTSNGFAKALAIGSANIKAAFDIKSDTTSMTVTAPMLLSITLSPANPSVLTLSTGKFTAKGTYSDGSTPDITSQVTWNSSNTGIATIAGDGTATVLTQGTTTISANLTPGGISGTTNLKATGGNLTSFAVSPVTVSLVKDTTSRITATGTFSNGSNVSTRDITGAVQWKVADTSRATVTAAGGYLMWLNALAVTPATIITATSGTLTPFTTTLTVTAPQLLSIALSTTILDLTAGTSSPLTMTATFSDGTAQDVTTLGVWTSDDTAKATVVAGGLGAERITGVAAGPTTIRATYTYNGKTVSAPVPVTVTIRPRTLQSLTISPLISSVTVGNQASFTATAGYGDGTTVDVTADTAWSIDTPNVAILTDSVNRPGQVLAVDSGSATLTASFGGKTPTQAATITVTGP